MSIAHKIERMAAPLRQQVVKLMREDILNGALEPGQRLIENVLCESYGVSRTVIREALRQLESEHLVKVLPSQGPIVTMLTEEEIKAIYVVRASLEGLAGELFAQNARQKDVTAMITLGERLERDYRNGTVESREALKAEFYALLLSGAGNEILQEALRGIHARIALFRRFAFVNEDRIALSIEELERIIHAAAIRRDPKAAREACEMHIVRAGKLAIIEYENRTRALMQA